MTDVNASGLQTLPPAPTTTSQRTPFLPDRVDGHFALLAFVVGFLFVRYVLFSWQGFGVSLFTFLYAGTASLYLHRRGHRQSGESLFWLGTLLATGLSYSLWTAQGLRPWREMFLFLNAVYYVVVTAKATLLHRTSDWLPLDGLRGLVAIPLGDLLAQAKSVAWLQSSSRQSTSANRQMPWPVIGGLLLSLVALMLIVPLLFAADSGGFARLTQGLADLLRLRFAIDPELLLQLALAFPAGAYIFALLAGSAHQRGSRSYTPERMSELAAQARFLPPATVNILLTAVNAVYIIFVLSQIPYFFSAFVGARPEGWEIYSAYARNGFFELLGLGLINLTLLAVANLGGKVRRRDSLMLRLLNTTLALMTILLIATAMSKMFLYIAVYGLSMRRLLPCIFMLFMAVLCAAIIVWQRRSFSLARFAAFSGAIVLTLLSLADPDSTVARYNASRYLNGTLPSFDSSILYTAGSAGVAAAERLLAGSSERSLRIIARRYLDVQYYEASLAAGTARDTLQNMVIRQKLKPGNN